MSTPLPFRTSSFERAKQLDLDLHLASLALASTMLVRYDPALPEFFETEEVAVALSHIAVMLHQARDVVALLGAGISTAAGVQVRA